MNLKVFLTAFLTVFLAELGDKTQLAGLVLAAKTKKPVAVFLGASLALVLVTLLAVAFASVITQYVPENVIKKTAAVAFVVMGVLIFFDVM